jgi:hypothetical protein
LHFSEDPTITRFVPHVAATAQRPEAFVWAVDAVNAPSYWFPRNCPRAMAWVTETTTPSDRERVLGPGGGTRVHALEYAWLERVRTVELFAYRFPAEGFEPESDGRHTFVATRAVEPLEPPTRVGRLLDLHAEAGIQLRILDSLWPFWDFVVSSTLGFSGIRLANAKPRPNPAGGAT